VASKEEKSGPKWLDDVVVVREEEGEGSVAEEGGGTAGAGCESVGGAGGAEEERWRGLTRAEKNILWVLLGKRGAKRVGGRTVLIFQPSSCCNSLNPDTFSDPIKHRNHQSLCSLCKIGLWS